jgi:predicted Zn-dependent protease|tara:strand:+ start:345 stop:566 length:222 start_codon:yes stop_codon:yes gene_type:complete
MDYSMGASGVWVDKGKRVFPIDEVTIVANWKKMVQKELTDSANHDALFGFSKTVGDYRFQGFKGVVLIFAIYS